MIRYRQFYVGGELLRFEIGEEELYSRHAINSILYYIIVCGMVRACFICCLWDDDASLLDVHSF